MGISCNHFPARKTLPRGAMSYYRHKGYRFQRVFVVVHRAVPRVDVEKAERLRRESIVKAFCSASLIKSTVQPCFSGLVGRYTCCTSLFSPLDLLIKRHFQDKRIELTDDGSASKFDRQSSSLSLGPLPWKMMFFRDFSCKILREQFDEPRTGT